MDTDHDRLARAILALLEACGPARLICPSEAARRIGGEGWRALMPATREAARTLARAGCIEITQRGRRLAPDVPIRGPIRLRRPAPDAQRSRDSSR